MSITFKKRGQKLVRNFSRFSQKAGEEGKESIKENLVGRISHIKNVRLLVVEWSLMVFAVIMLSVTQAFWYKNSYSTATFASGGTYSEATLGAVNSLNPLFATTNSEKVLSKLLFATLTAPDYSGHNGLALAESATTDDSGKIWTIRLRDGLKWSDGEPITNADVLFTVNLITNPAVNTTFSSNLTGVKVAEDEHGNIIFTLPSPYVNFSSALNIPILPKHILENVDPSLLLENPFSSQPISSGAFAYHAAQTASPTETVVYLSNNPYYYRGEPLLKNFTIYAFSSVDEISAALKSGTVTATAELLPTDSELVSSSTIYEKQSAINNGVFLFFNTTDGVFVNKTLRKSIQQGLDIASLRAPLGDELPLDFPILSSQIQLKNWPTLPDYNPDAARQTIKSINPSTPIRIVTVDSGYFKSLAENLTYQLENLGLTVDLTVYEAGSDFYINVIRPRSYDILIYEVELGSDPDIFAYYHSSQTGTSGLNLSNYTDSRADDLILAARSLMNRDTRAKKYEAFLAQWIEDAPAIGVYRANLTYYFNKNVRNFSADNHLVFATDRFADVEFWATEKTTKNRTP